MIFKDPWALMLIPFALLILFFAKKKCESPGIRFPDVELMTGLRETVKIKIYKNIIFLRALSCIFIVLAIARPQSILEESKITREGIDIVLAVDVSTSMLVEVLNDGTRRKNRLEAAKDVINNFIRARDGDRIGMVVFASRAYTACPLTLDHEWLIRNIERLEIGMIEDGTAIGSGLITSLNSIKNADTKSRIVILLTDGRNNAGEIAPAIAAEAAKALKVKVYTIGVGSKGAALYPVQDPFGRTVYKEADADIDEETLNMIAHETGAKYFKASDLGTLGEIYNEIGLLEKNKIEEKIYYEYKELFHLFLLPAIGLLFFEFILKNTVLRRLP